ncbi:Acg family FMN-binding oxidoreductase [Actinoallomurus iriomotensis]|uniref:NAD(P)H nitroreductase n=1 Tax=Actinoallomurus iriomotensis TaxID=478107 RepID=A0A9W6VS80_9ACTN|nr:hypothetical protein [Actinoallomurus iriomotensis]GLY77799.1 NAD(P)H nitroreductase [Actinoallomurus iriomotensis]
MDAVETPRADEIAHHLVDAAVWAPSVYDTRPWRFGTRGSTVTVHADPERRLEVADPDGRETMISCGAALYTLRLAMRDLGRIPLVRMLPDPDRPDLIAEVGVGGERPATAEERQMYAQIRHRHTHTGGFRPGGLPIGLLQALRTHAYCEQVSLRIVADPRARIALAALTEAAEQVQRQNPAYVAEVARWAPPPGAASEETCPRESARLEPDFAGRDFATGQGWGGAGSENRDATGVVAVLLTDGDGCGDRLCAGQALQRILLCAAEYEVSAAFHGQALEVPELREFIRTRFCDGAYPQMILRLGIAHANVVRRSVTELTRGEL